MATLHPKPGLQAAKSSPSVLSKKKSKKKSGKKATKSKFELKVSPPAQHDYRKGDYVRLKDGRQGCIQYVGQTAFSKHILYGIELDDKYEGKHSGMYKGVKYFDCGTPNKGVFVTLSRISALGSNKASTPHNLNISNRSKHGRKLSAMIYRGAPSASGIRGNNISRVSFVVPDMSALLSPTTDDEYDDDDASQTSTDSNLLSGFNSLVRAYSAEMRESLIINEENEEKYEAKVDPDPDKLRLTDTGKINISTALENKLARIKKKEAKYKHKERISVRIPFGAINSKCMAIILSFLTMRELSQYAFVSKSARDSIRLVALYDFRYMLYDALCVQDIRKILCILKFHKPKELILPMAYFIYDPVVLRLFLQFFNVTHSESNDNQHIFKYIHKLVIDDRDIRPNSWLMRPGNYPWNELCNRETSQDTVFPFELVECFQSLGCNLWELDIRYTMNVELSFFMKSAASILFLSVSAENRMDVEQFCNVTHLTIQNKGKTWEEIERMELLEWKSCFQHLTHLTIINQRFEAPMIDLLSAITWIPCIKSYFMSNCHFNEPTVFEAIEHMKEKSNVKNRLHSLTIKRHNLSRTLFTVISQFFVRINELRCIDCKLKKSQSIDFEFFTSMTHLTNINIINLKPKKKVKNLNYKQFMTQIFEKITKYVYICPVVIECNLIDAKFKIFSHIKCRFCKQLINKEMFADHAALMCPERSVECVLCKAKVKRKSMTYHWMNNCKEYRIQCFLCPKYFTVDTRHKFHHHILRHSMDLDEESGKYEMVFIGHKQAIGLTNDYPVYTITICASCSARGIAPVVSPKYRQLLIPKQCDSCKNYIVNDDDENKQQAKTKSKRISIMKKKGKKVLPHPYPKNVKLKSIKPK